MKEKWNYLIYLIWFAYLIVSAIYMFGQGFLLSRKTLNDVSTCTLLNSFDCDGRETNLSTSKPACSEGEKIKNILLRPNSPLVCLPNRNRIMFLLVDALRYDFTEFNTSNMDPLPFQNKLPIIEVALRKRPNGTRLFRFMADPPTTTLQRLKALMTGSLPTFIDASSNFAAMEIQEDNIIDQLNMGEGKAVLLGDDTWARLLPNRWMRSHALYSFHTWDLDTVDNEIDSKIYNEIQNKDWDLLIAHYLGVDHAGHRYGPNHQEMGRKLKELNHRIKKILDVLPHDVILYVIGDHGMTESGDHGGESKSERTSAFFAYRGSGFYNDFMPIDNEIQQTDFAQTLSAAIGRPPPAPSLGNLQLSVLPKLTVPQRMILLTNNLKQINHYMLRYGEESQQVSIDTLTQLINSTRDALDKAANVQNEADFLQYASNIRELVTNIRSTFREVWVEFDSLSMLRALLLLLIAIFFNWLIVEGIPRDRISGIFASSFVPSGIMALAVVVAICLTGYYFEVLDDVKHAIILSTGLVSGGTTCVLIVMHWGGICQRWYEGKLHFYERFSRSALFISALVLVSNSFIIEEGAALSFLVFTILTLIALKIRKVSGLLCWVGCGAALALSRSYRGCREEQGDCWVAGAGASIAGQASRGALVLALGSVASVVAIARRFIGWRGHGIIVAGTLACGHWTLGWGNLGSPSRSRLLGRISWMVLMAMFLLMWRRDGKRVVAPIIVCGLVLYLGNCLVLGVSAVPAAGLALFCGFCTIHLVGNLKGDGNDKNSLSVRCNTSVACLWALMALYQFYGTGHHATLGHVRWAPAFHAGDPNFLPFGSYITGTLVAMDLFGMPLMFGATLPLLPLRSKYDTAGLTGISPKTMLAAIFSVSLKFCLCFAIRVFVCALAATIHCRHLMIWGVFTPKLLFEAGLCTAALLGTILGTALTIWHMPNHKTSTS